MPGVCFPAFPTFSFLYSLITLSMVYFYSLYYIFGLSVCDRFLYNSSVDNDRYSKKSGTIGLCASFTWGTWWNCTSEFRESNEMALQSWYNKCTIQN